MKPHSYNPNLTFNDVRALMAGHDAANLDQLTQEFYDRTECGVSTKYILARPSYGQTVSNIIGVQFSTIVEGSPAEFTASPLTFPFTDRELAEAWDYLEQRAEETIEEMAGGHEDTKTQYCAGRQDDDCPTAFILEDCEQFDTLAEAICDCARRIQSADPDEADKWSVLRLDVGDNAEVLDYSPVGTGTILAVLLDQPNLINVRP